MVFDLCDDISECLGRLQLGALVGHLLTPGRGAWVMSFLGGPLIEGWGAEPREMAVSMLTLREGAPCPGERAKPIPRGTSGLSHRL